MRMTGCHRNCLGSPLTEPLKGHEKQGGMAMVRLGYTLLTWRVLPGRGDPFGSGNLRPEKGTKSQIIDILSNQVDCAQNIKF